MAPPRTVALVDTLVTDVVLPDGSGVDLVRAAVTLTPSLAIVVISGQATAPQTFELAELGAAQYLPKPVTQKRLLDTVAAARLACSVSPVVRSTGYSMRTSRIGCRSAHVTRSPGGEVGVLNL